MRSYQLQALGAAVLVALGLFGLDGNASTGSAAARPDEAATARIWRDCSGSLNEEHFGQAVGAIIDAVEATPRITQLELLRFSCRDERLDVAQPMVFTLMPEAAAGEHDGLARLFVFQRKLMDNEQAQGRRGVLEERLRPALMNRPAASAPCTRFDAVRNRIAATPRPIELVLTDGWVDCTQPFGDDPQLGKRIIVVLLPKNGDGGGDDPSHGNARRQDMLKVFPGARIVAPYAMTEALRATVTASPGSR